jgi:hypothetical protein
VDPLILDASVLIGLLDVADAHHTRASMTSRKRTWRDASY